MSKRKHEVNTKLEIIEEYKAGGVSVYQLAKKYGVGTKSIHSWYRNYQSFRLLNVLSELEKLRIENRMLKAEEKQ